MTLPFPNKTIHQLFEEQKLTYRELNERGCMATQRDAVYKKKSMQDEEIYTAATSTLHACVLSSAQAAAAGTAIIDTAASREYRYADLASDVDSLAQAIWRTVSPNYTFSCDQHTGKLIAVLCEKGYHQALATLAIMKSAHAYLPLHVDWPTGRLLDVLAEGGVDYVLVSRQITGDAALVAALSERHQLFIIEDLLLQGHNAADEPLAPVSLPNVSPDDIAYVIFTSGSTGRPKGVTISHRGALNTILAVNRVYAVNSTDRVLALSELSFDLSVYDIFGLLIAGGTVVFPDQKKTKDAGHWIELIERHQVSIWDTVPQLASLLADEYYLRNSTSQTLRLFLISGDKIPLTLPPHLRQVCPQAAVVSLGGATEGSIWSIWYEITKVEPEWRSIPYGFAMPNQAIVVLDEEGELCPIGVPGEIHIGGVGVALNYWQNEEKTCKSFIQHPRLGRLYCTGDLGALSEAHYVEFIGRKDRQVKIHGYRVELGEIEAQLAACSSIKDCVAVARDSLVMYYIANGAQSPTFESELKEKLRAQLPDYMIPQHFVRLDAFPLTSNGKLDTHALPAPQSSWNVLKSTPFVAPRNQLEVQLAALWSEALGQKQIGIHDDFFELGGDSLLAIKLVSAINRILNAEISVSDLFYFKNIEATAQKIALFDSKDRRKEQQQEERNKNEVTESETLILRDYFLSDFKLTYNESFVVELNQSVSVEKFRLSVETLLSEYEILHANYFCTAGMFSRTINKKSPIEYDHFNFSHYVDPDAEFLNCIHALIKKEFNIEQDKLIRFYLFQLSENRYRIFVVFFHAILDVTSLPILCRKLFHLMNLGGTDRKIKLGGGKQNKFSRDDNPDDFYLLGSQIKEHYRKGLTPAAKPRHDKLTYWCDFFNQFEYCPISPKAEHSKSRWGKQEAFVIENDVKEKLLELSKKLHISLFDIVLGCFMLLLNKFTQQNHIAIRSNINERIYASQYAETLGCFINNLFLGIKIDADATLLNLLIDSKKNKDRAMNNCLSYDRLIEHFRQKVIDLSHVHFNLVQDDLDDLDFYPSQRHTHSGQVKNNLYVELEVKKDKILARVVYNVEAFDKNFITSLIQCYTTILKKVELFLNQPVKSINVLPDAQYHQVIHSFNAGKIYTSTKTIHQVFEEQVDKNPKHIAISYNGTLLTYQELNAKANQLAHYLRQNDAVIPGSLITLCLEKSEETLIAILAVLKTGAAYVPIDPRSPEDRMRYMLQDINSQIILTNRVHRQKIEIFTPHDKADIIVIDEPLFTENLNKQSIKNLDVNINNVELAYVIYTSGTTGNPKGVMQTHYNVVRLFVATEDFYGFKNDDVWILFHSYVFDFSIWEMWGALFYGGKLIVPTEEEIKNPNTLYALCYREQVTVLNQTPQAFYQFIDAAIHKDKLPLKYVLLGGEALNTKRLKPWAEYYGFRQLKLVNLYGITETSVVITYKEIAPQDLEGSSCIGKVVPDMRTYVLDAQMLPVPLGAAGELYVGGSGLARGYWNKPLLTQERFVGNPFQTEEEQKKQYNAKLYKTGDVVRWLPDGELEYIGRNDLQVKIRGYRVELDDIAHNILEYPLVSEAVVLAAEDPAKGKYLVAYYVIKENGANNSATVLDIDAVQLRQFLEKKLPPHMLPTSYTKLDALPLTVQGKLDRKKLLSLTNKAFNYSARYVPPRTRNEIALVEIWAKALQLEKNVVGVEDDFFALGGHSLLITNLMSQIQTKFNVTLQVRDLFIKPTVRGLLSLIDKRIALPSSQHHSLRSEIDFDAEAILPKDIYPEEMEYMPIENPQNIFLTGASGFLGGFLLEELLKKTMATIYCLVRANNTIEAEHKLFVNLKEKYIAVETYKHRIVALPGDLAQPRFGFSEETFELLTKKIDVIYHNGATVNFLYPYEFLKAANVDSVKEVLRLAKAKRLKPIHYISTLGVFTSLHLNRSISIINEDQPLDFGDQLFMGYSETKWVAEKLLCEAKKRQFPICIYRFMEVTGHNKTGVSNTKSLDMAFLKGCVEMGIMEDLPIKKYYTPVDYLAQAIVYLSQQAASIGQNFHLHNPNPINQKELVKMLNDLGYPVAFSPYETWVQKIIEDPQNPLYVYQPLFTEKWAEENITVIEMFAEQRRPRYGFQHAMSGLAESGLTCPKIDREYMRRCLDYLIQTGYISVPKVKQRK
jgi:amino acid adenylation domain-containing protein/thioester reductase-like protein